MHRYNPDPIDRAAENVAQWLKTGLGLALLCVATALAIWLFFYLSDVLAEAVVVAVTAAIVGVGLGFGGLVLGHIAKNDKNTRESWAGIGLLIGLIWVIVPHTLMSLSMWGLKAEFWEVTRQSRGSYAGTIPSDGEKSTVLLSYDGKLDKIVDRRNLRLHKWGFVGLSRWETGSWGTRTIGLYLWLPWPRAKPQPRNTYY